MYAVGVRVVGLIACITFFVLRVAGQDAPGDTTWLSPLEISGSPLEFYSPGGHIEPIDSVNLETYRSASLGTVLQVDKGIYLKEYGPGMLSSISLRGTAPHHTSLLWNGLPVNFPSLGVADYSLLPVFFIDRAEVLYGGSSAMAGSGAIGGAISVEDIVQPNTQFLSVLQEAGSFGTWMTGIKAQKAGELAGGSLAAFFKRAENNFTYVNRARAGSPTERQKHGAYEGRGVKAALFFRPWTGGEFSFNSWLTSFEREIIPPYTVPVGNDHQNDLSLRLELGYKQQLAKQWKASAQLGRVYDEIKFNGLFSATTQYLWSGNVEGAVSSWLHVKMGSLINNILADVPEYGGMTTENRADVFVFFNIYPAKRWELSVNNRYGWVAGDAVPYTPTFGSSYILISRRNHELKWRAQGSRSYRVPTLNDRYWNPGGNPDLLPEAAVNAETGLDWSHEKDLSTWSISLTTYAHWVNNWILWLPQASSSIWSPQNVRNVFSRGGEFTVSYVRKLASIRLSNRLHYAFTSAEVQTGYPGDEAHVGNQLPYTPQHQGSWNINGELRKWSASVTSTYYGRRFTLIDNDRELPPYALFDINARKRFSINRSDISVQISVRNLLNTSYENLEYRPMPGRSYQMQLNYTLK